MKTTANYPDSFTADDIRKNRDNFSARHTDANGKIDWSGAFADTEKGAAAVRAEIERIRAEKRISLGGIGNDNPLPDEVAAFEEYRASK